MNTKHVQVLLAALGVVVFFLGSTRSVYAESLVSLEALTKRVNPSALVGKPLHGAKSVEDTSDVEDISDNDDVETQAADVEAQIDDVRDYVVENEEAIIAGKEELTKLYLKIKNLEKSLKPLKANKAFWDTSQNLLIKLMDLVKILVPVVVGCHTAIQIAPYLSNSLEVIFGSLVQIFQLLREAASVCAFIGLLTLVHRFLNLVNQGDQDETSSRCSNSAASSTFSRPLISWR